MSKMLEQILQRFYAASPKDSLVFETQLNYANLSFHIQCNNEKLDNEIQEYYQSFSHNADASETKRSLRITVMEAEALDLELAFKHWPREAGKQGSAKDSFYDLPEEKARLVRKVRTGMVFLQSQNELIAIGPCKKNVNQVVNFINHQLLNYCLQQNALLCHAAALQVKGHGLAIAGFSGGGKSTSMLHLMDLPEAKFISNDRVFLKAQENSIRITGLPKLPRINPGTIVHNPKLHNLIDAEQRERFQALPKQELWQLEQKYDADVIAIWGKESIVSHAQLDSFFILNWQHDSSETLSVNSISPAERQDLLPAVMKSFGCFYQYTDGHFDQAPVMDSIQRYIEVLSGIQLYEVAGKVDFAAFKQWITNNIVK